MGGPHAGDQGLAQTPRTPTRGPLGSVRLSCHLPGPRGPHHVPRADPQQSIWVFPKQSWPPKSISRALATRGLVLTDGAQR